VAESEGVWRYRPAHAPCPALLKRDNVFYHVREGDLFGGLNLNKTFRIRLNLGRAPKQHMSAIRMLFAWLTEKSILAMNPAREVKTEKFYRTEGKTPAFDTEQVQKVLDKIDTSNDVGLRDSRSAWGSLLTLLRGSERS
jgi:hypothetical protein